MTVSKALNAIAIGLGLVSLYAMASAFWVLFTDPDRYWVASELMATSLAGFCLAIFPAALAQYLKETREFYR